MTNETKSKRDNRPSVMGRPVERTGSYRRITLELSTEALDKIRASGKTYRAYIEAAIQAYEK